MPAKEGQRGGRAGLPVARSTSGSGSNLWLRPEDASVVQAGSGADAGGAGSGQVGAELGGRERVGGPRLVRTSPVKSLRLSSRLAGLRFRRQFLNNLPLSVPVSRSFQPIVNKR